MRANEHEWLGKLRRKGDDISPFTLELDLVTPALQLSRDP